MSILNDLRLHPVRTCFTFVVSMWLFALVSNRFILFKDAYINASKQYRDDSFFYTTICGHDKVRNQLGRNVEMCHNAEMSLRTYPIVRAFEAVISNTHLCGDVTCLDVFRSFSLEIGSNLIFVIIAALLSPLAFFRFFNGTLNKVERWKKRRDFAREYANESLALTFSDKMD